jgi:hypothetical protein
MFCTWLMITLVLGGFFERRPTVAYWPRMASSCPVCGRFPGSSRACPRCGKVA